MVRLLIILAVIAGLVWLHALIVRPNPVVDKSDHFDGQHFFNPQSVDHGFGLLMKWVLNRDRGPWADYGGYGDYPAGPIPAKRIEGDQLRVTLVGHATLLIQTAGLNILTDPIWAERAGPTSFIGTRRIRPPAIRFADLPPIDLVLVSHGHYDHMNIATLKRLFKAHKPQFLLPLGQGKYLRRAGISGITELDWWQSQTYTPTQIDDESAAVNGSARAGTKIWLVPARHWSARWIGDQNRALWGGFAIETASGPVYFAGDTGYGEHFRQIAEKLGPPRLALMPVGAYLPEFFMADVHTSPVDAIAAHQDMQVKSTMAMHFGTFPLGDDGEHQATEVLTRLIAEQGLSPDSVRIPEFGQPIDID